MAIDNFTKEQFENIMPVGTEYVGLESGEHCYRFPVDSQISVFIRSSIRGDGVAADAGEDSIRAWLINGNGMPLAGKVNAYTTRVNGWEDRLFYNDNSVLKTLVLWRWRAGDCDACGLPRMIFKAGLNAKNPGRKFAKCFNKYCSKGNNWGGWVDDEPTDDEINKLRGFITNDVNGSVKDFGDNIAELDFLADEDAGVIEKTVAVRRTPNAAQMAVIEAPIDANMRVMAPPGSGKTFTIVERIIYLTENGVDPDNILAVTFSKNMADELLAKILEALPHLRDTAAMQQTCTIHAICFRILRSYGDKRRVAKEWEEKKIVQNIADNLWINAEARPGYKEILHWINVAKFNGYPASTDLDFFVRHLGDFHGRLLDDARRMYDNAMKKDGLISFSDMLFDVEQMLIHDHNIRNTLQSKFSHVIVDESQDVSSQALRILITLSLDPGRNDVYES